MCGVGALRWTNGSLGFCPPAAAFTQRQLQSSVRWGFDRAPARYAGLGHYFPRSPQKLSVLLPSEKVRAAVQLARNRRVCPQIVSLSLSRMIFIKFLPDGTTRLCPYNSYELWYLLRPVTQVLLSTPSASAAAFLRIDFISSLYFSFITSWK